MTTVEFWLHRILSEKTEDLKRIATRISELNHQAENFEVMHDHFQREVVQSLILDMNSYGWDIPTELRKLVGEESPASAEVTRR